MAGINNQYNNYNPNVNVFGVRKGAKPEKAEAPKVEDKAVQPEVKPQERTQVSANDVLSFMANSSIYTQVAATKNVNPAKYVTSNQKAEISASMAEFESVFEDKLNSIYAEVPGITEAAAMTLAAKMVEDEI